ncbi:MAG: outer membrane lipoprotein carrier protein LolA [Verrucomicrobia bacterium]|nr:outer membrane lipoprotein carrier protein LolA [Verrucomicrobiota bacterium]
MRRKFISAFIASAFLAGSAAAVAAPMSSGEIQDLLNRLETMHESNSSLQADFREERHMSMLKEPVVSQGKIWFTIPDKIRRDIGGNTPSTTVINGRKMVIFYPKFKEEEVYDLEKRPMLKDSLQALTAGLNFRQVSTYYNVEGSKEGNDYQIVLTPKSGAIRKVVKSVTLTLDRNLNPQHVVFVSSRGERVEVSYSDVRREPVPESMYQFNAPPGTNVTTPLGS